MILRTGKPVFKNKLRKEVDDMKEYHILIACGSGIATSTVIANRVKNLCEDNGSKSTAGENCGGRKDGFGI